MHSIDLPPFPCLSLESTAFPAFSSHLAEKFLHLWHFWDYAGYFYTFQEAWILGRPHIWSIHYSCSIFSIIENWVLTLLQDMQSHMFSFSMICSILVTSCPPSSRDKFSRTTLADDVSSFSSFSYDDSRSMTAIEISGSCMLGLKLTKWFFWSSMIFVM